MSSQTEYDQRFRHANVVTSGSNPSGRSSGVSGATTMIEQTPDDATDDWIATAKREQSDEPLRNYGTVENMWTDFCAEHDIGQMSEVNGADLM